jgi:hypothetical protein
MRGICASTLADWIARKVCPECGRLRLETGTGYCVCPDHGRLVVVPERNLEAWWLLPAFERVTQRRFRLEQTVYRRVDVWPSGGWSTRRHCLPNTRVRGGVTLGRVLRRGRWVCCGFVRV